MCGPSLTTIPTDIQLVIVSFLQVKDLICLVSTCKALYSDLYDNWHLWLHYYCELVNCYDLRFGPVDPSTLSIDDLRKSVTRPYRFEQTLRNKTLDSATPTHAALSQTSERFVLVAIVPGGRWLVTASDPAWTEGWVEMSSIRVWDLHQIESGVVQATATVDVTATPQALTLQAAEKGFMIFVRSQTFMSERCIFYAIAFDPGATEKTLHILAQASHSRRCFNMVVDGRYLAVQYDTIADAWSDEHGVLLWDWVQDEWTTLDYQSALVESLVSVTEEGITTWRLHCSTLYVFGPLKQLKTPQGAPRSPLLEKPMAVDDRGLRMFARSSLRMRTWSHKTPSLRLTFYNNVAMIFNLHTQEVLSTHLLADPASTQLISRREFLAPLAQTINGHLVLLRPAESLTIFRVGWTADFPDVQTYFDGVDRPFGARPMAFICALTGVLGDVDMNGKLTVWRQD